MLSDLLLMKVF